MEPRTRSNAASKAVRRRRFTLLLSVALFVSACGQSSGNPTPSNAPGPTINGRASPDANGNNRDQPASTSPASPGSAAP